MQFRGSFVGAVCANGGENALDGTQVGSRRTARQISVWKVFNVKRSRIQLLGSTIEGQRANKVVQTEEDRTGAGIIRPERPESRVDSVCMFKM